MQPFSTARRFWSPPPEDAVHALLELPSNIRVLSIIGIGRPAEHPEPISADALPAEKISNKQQNNIDLKTDKA